MHYEPARRYNGRNERQLGAGCHVSVAREMECRAMMGTKERAFAPLCNRSLEDLVPADNFYRHLVAKLDLRFVRNQVRTTYNRVIQNHLVPQAGIAPVG